MRNFSKCCARKFKERIVPIQVCLQQLETGAALPGSMFLDLVIHPISLAPKEMIPLDWIGLGLGWGRLGVVENIPPVGSLSFGNISVPHIDHTAAAVTTPVKAFFSYSTLAATSENLGTFLLHVAQASGEMWIGREGKGRLT